RSSQREARATRRHGGALGAEVDDHLELSQHAAVGLELLARELPLLALLLELGEAFLARQQAARPRRQRHGFKHLGLLGFALLAAAEPARAAARRLARQRPQRV